MLEVVARESAPFTVQLSDQQAHVLIELGRQLAGAKSWWGAQDSDTAGAVIHVSRLEGSSWRVVFKDVVGVVAIGETQIRVAPKIPEAHFNFLASHSTIAPRLAAEQVLVDRDTQFADLLSRWFVQASETLLRIGLRREYAERVDELTAVQGKMDVLATAVESALGRPVAVCEFDELCEDTPLNRLIKAAARLVAGLPLHSADVRARARRIVYRMPLSSSLRHSDMRAEIDRLTRHYGPVITLAKLILDGGGVSTTVGEVHGSAFLIRTPEIIEDGLRTALSERLPNHKISKKRLILGDSGVSINPDLVFDDGAAVGDVKYRYLGRDWDRGSFNQAVTFATGFGADRCGVIGFTGRAADALPRPVRIGPISVQALSWAADRSTKPDDSLGLLVESCRDWLARTEVAGGH